MLQNTHARDWKVPRPNFHYGESDLQNMRIRDWKSDLVNFPLHTQYGRGILQNIQNMRIRDWKSGLVTFQRIYPVWDRNSTKRTKHLCTWQEKWPTHISEDIPSMWFHKNTQNIRVRDGKSGLVTFTRTCRLWNSDFTKHTKTFLYMTGHVAQPYFGEDIPSIGQWFYNTSKTFMYMTGNVCVSYKGGDSGSICSLYL